MLVLVYILSSHGLEGSINANTCDGLYTFQVLLQRSLSMTSPLRTPHLNPVSPSSVDCIHACGFTRLPRRAWQPLSKRSSLHLFVVLPECYLRQIALPTSSQLSSLPLSRLIFLSFSSSHWYTIRSVLEIHSLLSLSASRASSASVSASS
jgi:hypothetical protein